MKIFPSKLNIEDFRKVIWNILSLVILQVGNYIVPLVLMPYIIFILGVKGFGVLSISLAFLTFFKAITSYGFDLTGSKYISESIHHGRAQNEIYSRVIYAKLMLFIFCGALLFIISMLPSHDSHDIKLTAIYLLVVLSDVLFPMWFFHGIQDMKKITVFKLSSRFIYVGLVINLLQKPDDIYLLPLIEGGIGIMFSIYAILMIRKQYNVKFCTVSAMSIFVELKKSWYVFISRVSVLFYTSFNTILLGMMTSPIVVGIYTIAEKLYMALREVLNPVTQAFFPYLVQQYNKNETRFHKSVKITSLTFIISIALIATLSFIFSDNVITYLADQNIDEIITVFSVFNFTLFFSFGGYLSSLLIIKSESKNLFWVTFTTTLVNLVLVYPFIYYYSAIGLAYCFLIVQIVHFTLQIYANRATLHSTFMVDHEK